MSICRHDFIPDTNRQIERQLVSVDNIVIGGLQTLTITPQGPPTNLQLIKEVKVDDECITVVASGEDVFIGTKQGKILKIDKQGRFQVFGNIGGYIVGLVIHSGALYALNTYTSKIGVFQYDLGTMQRIRFWDHTDKSTCWGSRMVVTQNQLVVADVTNQRLTIYSLTGQLIRHVDCHQISTSWVSICVSPSNPDVIIVSDYNSCKVFSVNLTTGAVLWINSDISGPQGIVSYGSEHVLVIKQSQTTNIRIININTGKTMQNSVDSPLVLLHLHVVLNGPQTLLKIPFLLEKSLIVYVYIGLIIRFFSKILKTEISKNSLFSV